MKAAASAASSAEGAFAVSVVVAAFVAAVVAAAAATPLGASSIAVVPADASEEAGETGSLRSSSPMTVIEVSVGEEGGGDDGQKKKNVDRF